MAIVAESSRTNWRPKRRMPSRRKRTFSEQEAIVLPSERMQGGAISGGKVQERLQPYKDKVALHQRNVEAIRKEIANLR
jgi:predicted transcriptional regulator